MPGKQKSSKVARRSIPVAAPSKSRNARPAVVVKLSATDRLASCRCEAAALLKVGGDAKIVAGPRCGEVVRVEAIRGGYVDARFADGGRQQFDAYKLEGV